MNAMQYRSSDSATRQPEPRGPGRVKETHVADEDLTTEQPNDSDFIKKLRGEIRQHEKTTKKLNQQLREKTTTNLIYDAGGGHLNEKQKRAVVRELEDFDGEPDTDAVQSALKDLGYLNEGQGQQVQGQNQSGQQGLQQVDQNQQLQQPVTPGGVGDDFTNAQAPNVDPNQFNPMNQANQPAPSPQQQSAQAMMNMQANQAQQTVQAPSYEDQLRAAKTPEELRDLIRNQGPANGMKHQWDA